MSVELGMVPVIVRRAALRAIGIEMELISMGGVLAVDEHLYARSFMSSLDADAFMAELLLMGLAPDGIAREGCTWITLGRVGAPYWPICHFQYAYLTEAGPGEIVELEGFAKRRPNPRPWTSWPPE